jgi:hypothetical protein
MIQLRQETGLRILERVYARDVNVPDKWWICFSKRKFMGINFCFVQVCFLTSSRYVSVSCDALVKNKYS